MSPFSLTYVSGSFGGSVCSWFWDVVWGWRTLLTRSVIPLKGNHLYEQADSATQKPVNKPVSIQHTPVSSWQLQYSYIHMKHTCTATKNYWDREKERKTERQGQTSLNPQTTSCILHTKLVTFSSGKLKSYWPALCSEIRMQFLSQMFTFLVK